MEHRGWHLQVLCVLMLVAMPFASFSATAQGGGLLLDETTLVTLGHMEEGSGDVNLSIVVMAHDVQSNGTVNATIETMQGAVVTSSSTAVQLLAGETMTAHLNHTSLAIGQYVVTFSLNGDIGTSFDTNTTSVSSFIKRLAPANPVLSEPSSWVFTFLDGQTGLESGNSTIRDGDDLLLSVPVDNTGEVEWQGEVNLTIGASQTFQAQLAVPALDEEYANFTITSLSEAPSITVDAHLGSQTKSTAITVGPPPLANLSLILTPSEMNPSLGDIVTWNAISSNQGEKDWNGSLVCGFSGTMILSVNLSIVNGSQAISNFTLQVRPGSLICQLEGDVRIHEGSLIQATHQYEMPAAHFSGAGSGGVDISGANFHIGDTVTFTIIVHNGGDFEGNASLQIDDGITHTDGTVRSMTVGSSIELEAQHTLAGIAGLRNLSWSVVSLDGLVDGSLSGFETLHVIPAQTLSSSVSAADWTNADGVQVVIELSLSEGRSRPVTLEVGHSDDGEESVMVTQSISMTPGIRTLSYSLGNPSSADLLWVRTSVDGWQTSSNSILFDSSSIAAPDIQPLAILGVAEPAVPISGSSAQIAYTLSNSGTDDIEGGVMMLIQTSTNEILATDSSPLVPAGESRSGTISIDSWPSGSSVDLELRWVSGVSLESVIKSYPSKVEDSTEDDSLPWVSIMFGVIAGVVISAIARFVFVWQDQDPEEKRRLKDKRREARAAARDEVRSAHKEKVAPSKKREVNCPSCDQSLRVPMDYSGTARCPACSDLFPVVAPNPEPQTKEEFDEDLETVVEELSPVSVEEESIPKPVKKPDVKRDIRPTAVEGKKRFSVSRPEEEEEEIPHNSSKTDEIRCPDCGQRLRVPLEKRPVKARCPRCKCTFEARNK